VKVDKVMFVKMVETVGSDAADWIEGVDIS
jgi:hypothetical protein